MGNDKNKIWGEKFIKHLQNRHKQYYQGKQIFTVLIKNQSDSLCTAQPLLLLQPSTVTDQSKHKNWEIKNNF